jgi:hypothetical protein
MKNEMFEDLYQMPCQGGKWLIRVRRGRRITGTEFVYRKLIAGEKQCQ